MASLVMASLAHGKDGCRGKVMTAMAWVYGRGEI